LNIKRKTRFATIFPDETSCLRLITAILREKSEEWETGRKHLVIEGSDQLVQMKAGTIRLKRESPENYLIC